MVGRGEGAGDHVTEKGVLGEGGREYAVLPGP